MIVGQVTVQAIYAFASLSSLLLAYVVWRHRHKTAAVPLLVAIAAGFCWSTTLFLATLAESYRLSAALSALTFLWIVLAIAAVFVFALVYTGRRHLVTKRTLALLSIEPVLVVCFALLNPGDLFFTSSWPSATAATGVDATLGVAFVVHTAYSYVLIAAVGAMILDLAYRTRAMYRGQLVALISAVVVPLVPNLVAIFGLVNFDATPVGFIVANALFAVAIVRYRLIDLSPIARDRVVENVRDAMFVVDTDDQIVDVNPAGEALVDTFVGDVDVVGEDARELLAFLPDLAGIYDEIVGTGTEQSVEYSIGGGHYDAEATPIDDGRGRTVGWLFLIRDVTEQRRRERQLRERNEQLDKFASVVSHDLRNPLQVAGGRVDLAMETGDTSHLAAVQRAHDRMEDIIADVLSLARSGEIATDLAPVDFEAAAEAAWSNVETTGAALHVASTGRVTADDDRLARLLENLFRNAVEHGSTSPRSASSHGDAVEHGSTNPHSQAREDAVEHGSTSPRSASPREDAVEGGRAPETAADGVPSQTGADTSNVEVQRTGGTVGAPESGAPDGAAPTVTVEVGIVRDGDDPVGFYVADDGPGIPPEDRETVFESGYSTGRDGTGFGLTIVSQIAGAHGWEVGVTDSEAGGARFEVAAAEVVGA